MMTMCDRPTIFRFIVVVTFLAMIREATSNTSLFLCEDDFDCLPHGNCSPDLACLCQPGYYGDQCTEECPLECLNGGQCELYNEHGGMDDHDEFRCNCPSQYRGAFCQHQEEDPQEEEEEPRPTAQPDCMSNYDCAPHGSCGNDFMCRCDDGYTGNRCQLLSCPLQCQNGGVCNVSNDHGGVKEFDDFYCDCPEGTKGGLCEHRTTGGVGMISVTRGNPASNSKNKTRRYAGWIIVAVLLVAFGMMALFWCLHRRCQKKTSEVESKSENVSPGPEDNDDLPSVA